jgi:hypothetical protein
MSILSQRTIRISHLPLAFLAVLMVLEASFSHDMTGHYHSHPLTPPSKGAAPAQAEAFSFFAPHVGLRWDDRFLFVESDGLPSHNMMVGITNWQQQVPLPQNYTSANAWQIPLQPVPAKTPISVENRFLRGAIAIAANGIPIFNPRNNRGELSYEIGELDQWGGHCGRADDYHYHIAPLHLQETTGKDHPIAYALDGYPIYGLTEPDGSPVQGLDALHGHTSPVIGYHYHASQKYPYVIGGFHGEVVERDGQVDPQPRTQPVREALTPLRAAKITAFETNGNTRKLTYELQGDKFSILYNVSDDHSVTFDFLKNGVSTRKEAYRQKPDRDPPPREDSKKNNPPAPLTPAINPLMKPTATFQLTSPEVVDGGNLPMEYTGDGPGSTLPLEWQGVPDGTKSFVLIMDHEAPGGEMKSYWNIWDIPANVVAIPKNAQGIGQLGKSFRGEIGYEPPHSKGPGPKIYVITLYALTEPVRITRPAKDVTREVLLEAMKGKVLSSSSLHVVYSRGDQPPPPQQSSRIFNEAQPLFPPRNPQKATP